MHIRTRIHAHLSCMHNLLCLRGRGHHKCTACVTRAADINPLQQDGFLRDGYGTMRKDKHNSIGWIRVALMPRGHLAIYHISVQWRLTHVNCNPDSTPQTSGSAILLAGSDRYLFSNW